MKKLQYLIELEQCHIIIQKLQWQIMSQPYFSIGGVTTHFLIFKIFVLKLISISFPEVVPQQRQQQPQQLLSQWQRPPMRVLLPWQQQQLNPVTSEHPCWCTLIPGVNFTNMFTSSFYLCRSQKRKNSVKSSVSFCAFGICAHKSCL